MLKSLQGEIMLNLRKLEEKDLALLQKWENTPHVKEFWDSDKEYDEEYCEYVFRTKNDSLKQFIFEYEDQPVGYIQYYHACEVGDGWWENQKPGTYGIDLYIGESKFLGLGLGKKIIELIIEEIKIQEEVVKIIADPCPENFRMQNILEDIGFVNSREITTPDGKAILFIFNP